MKKEREKRKERKKKEERNKERTFKDINGKKNK